MILVKAILLLSYFITMMFMGKITISEMLICEKCRKSKSLLKNNIIFDINKIKKQ